MDKGDERKKQLLQVALDVFIEKGYYGTSTREIARRAGVSSGLSFHYLNSWKAIPHLGRCLCLWIMFNIQPLMIRK